MPPIKDHDLPKIQENSPQQATDHTPYFQGIAQYLVKDKGLKQSLKTAHIYTPIEDSCYDESIL